jgi:hypothetical protein
MKVFKKAWLPSLIIETGMVMCKAFQEQEH